MGDTVDIALRAWLSQRPDLDFWPEAVVGRIQRLARLLNGEIQQFCAEHGLEPGEADVLLALRRAGEPYEVSAGELLRTAMVTSGAITNRVDRMHDKGLVERVRDPSDRRSVRVRLTARGRKLADDVVGAQLAHTGALLSTMPRERADELAALLRELLESLGDVATPDYAE